MAAFSYKVPGLQKAPADVAGEVCLALSRTEQGLTPRTLLDASRSESAPLHGEFEWNDAKAAENYRLSQARGIIRNLVVITTRADGSPVMDRKFVSAPGGTGRYVELQAALSREDWQEHLLEQARGEMKAFLAKYRRLQALAQVNNAMQTALDLTAGQAVGA